MRVSGTPNPVVTAIKALTSLLLLAVLVVGVPLGLALVTPMVWAEAGEDVLHLWDTSRQDGGSVFLVLLLGVAWLAWVQFTLSVALELPAQLKGRAARRRRGFALSQGAAASLIGAVLVLLPTGTALATPTTAVAVSATATPGAEEASERKEQVRKPAGQHRVYVVQDAHESLISIASDQLGDDSRFQEIADLNTGREMPDGTAYSPELFLKKGWKLLLPDAPRTSAGGGPNAMSADTREDSRPVGEKPAPAATDSSSGEHVVAPGDTLWDISEEHYGDGSRYTEVYDANRETITEPDLIYPGDTLAVPQEPAPGDQDSSSPKGQKDGAGEGQESSDPGERDSDDEAGKVEEQQPEAEKAVPPPPEREGDSATPTPPAQTSPSPAPSAGEKTTPAPASSESEDDGNGAILAAGAALSVIAAGLVATVFTRRVVQQRRRRRGRRIAMPQGRVARTEEDLRATAPPIEPAVLDGLLRTTAASLAEAGRELPEVRAVVLGDQVELHLVEPAAAVAPFVSEDGGRRWVCPVTATGDASGEQVDPPYPGLVVLGSLEDQRLVLVDLEHVGVLQITGPHRYEVARSVAVEAAISQVAEDLTVVAPEQVAPRLAALSDRVTAGSPAAVLEGLRVHHAGQQDALRKLGLGSLRQARLGEAGAGGWTPHIVITDDEWDDAEVEELGDLVASTPRSATAVVVTGEEAVLPETGWVLHADGGQVQLPGGLECSLAALDDQTYTDIVAMLDTADSSPDVPAPPSHAPSWVEPVAAEPSSVAESQSLSVYEAREASPTNSGIGIGASLFTQLGDLDHGEDETDAVDGEEALEDRAVEQEPTPSTTASAASAGWPPYDQSAEHIRAERGEDLLEENSGKQDTPTLDLSKQPLPLDTGPAFSRPVTETGRSSLSETGAAPEGCSSTVPFVRVLGPVDVLGTEHEAETKRVRRATELTTWLLFHPGSDREAIEAALWRGRAVERRTVTQLISRTRKWLGAGDGAYLPYIADAPGARYRLSDAVSSDWHQFLELVARGERTSGLAGTRALRQALELVRGTPFSGVPAHRYVWAEPLVQEMIAVLVDAAELLSERYRVAGEPREALWAATKGLDAAPEAEQLHRARFVALHALGDLEGLQRAADDLDELNDSLGLEMEEETLETLEGLMSRT